MTANEAGTSTPPAVGDAAGHGSAPPVTANEAGTSTPPAAGDEPHRGAGERRAAWRALEDVVERGLDLSRLAVLIPVAVLLLAALGDFVYGVVFFVDSVRRIADHPFPVGTNVGLFVLLIDLLLVGTTMLIAAVGFYELFVNRVVDGTKGHVPVWLVMRDLNDLKSRVASMLVLVSAVTFVDVVVDFPSARDVLFLGIGVGVVIVALTVFLRVGTRDGSRGG